MSAFGLLGTSFDKTIVGDSDGATSGMDGSGHGAGGYGSNAGGFGSNAGGFGSNAGGDGSGAGGFGSNAGGDGSHAGIVLSAASLAGSDPGGSGSGNGGNGSGNGGSGSGNGANGSGNDASGSRGRSVGGRFSAATGGSTAANDSVALRKENNPLLFSDFASSLWGDAGGTRLVYGVGANGRSSTSAADGSGGPGSPAAMDGAAADPFAGLSYQDLAERRGKLALDMQAQLDKIAAAYRNDELKGKDRRDQLQELRDGLADMEQRDTELEDAQDQLSLFGEGSDLFSVLGVYLFEYMESPEDEGIYDRRLNDRERLRNLRADRKALVEKIKALKESGESVERYKELQGKLDALDGRIETILARDERRFDSEVELGADVILPQLEMELESVGPDVGDTAAVKKFLEAPVAVSADDLVAIMPNLSHADAKAYEPHLNQAMEEFGINTPQRQAAFLAQLAHESVGLTAFEEYASGAAYEGRSDLGNVHPGDGVRYKGRGPIQLTGRSNYRTTGAALGLDLEGNPTRASDPDVGFRIAGYYWKSRGLNELADVGDFEAITYRINGGYNGAEDRRNYWARAKQVVN